MKLYFETFKKFNDFYGKACRNEFYNFATINIAVIVAFVIAIFFVENLFVLKVLHTLLGSYLVAIVLPSLALIMRRLNDLGRRRRWIFMLLVPVVGIIYLLWVCMQSGKSQNDGAHQYTA